MLCGPTCIQYVHKAHGKRLSIARAKKLAHTTRYGTYADDMVEAFTALGYKAYVKHNLTWSSLRRLVDSGADVVATWWSVLDDGNGHAALPDGHYSVIKKVTRDRVVIFDPDPADEITLPKEMFLAHWWDYENSHAGRKSFVHSAVIVRPKHSRKQVAHK